jgi:soluble lytic murein transglycosylase
VKKPSIACAIVWLVASAGHGRGPHAQQIEVPHRASIIGGSLAPTEHPPLPGHRSQFWLVPESSLARTSAASSGETPLTRFARGVKLFREGEYTSALPLVSTRALASTPLADYARYYTGLTQLRLQQFEEAGKTLSALAQAKPRGFLLEATALRRAELAFSRNDPAGALDVLEPLAREKTTALAAVLIEIARAAQAAGDREKAIAHYRRAYFEFPLSPESDLAKFELDTLDAAATPLTGDRLALELGRAERLFGARRYGQARDAFAALSKAAGGDHAEVVALRIAECDYFLGRHRASRDALRPFLEDAKRKAEARFFHLTATRALGDLDTYVALATGLVKDFPDESWTEETLNNLASHYIIEDEDAEADRVFRDLYRRFPQGRHAERAAWKIGWWAYKNGNAAEAINVFEGAAAAMRRADMRPAWLYWSARSHDALGQRDTAVARYRLVATDYLNSYYGRLSARILEERKAVPPPSIVASRDGGTANAIPTDAVIRQLIGLELYDDAVRELQYAERAWGDSPAIHATYAWIYNRQGDLRRGINSMKRAYPQYLAAGGEELPADLLGVLFPLDYWPLIEKYCAARGLDPYMIAALMAQESTFDHDVRSVANAYGLMQVVPATGRRYARSLRIRWRSTTTLTDPESNIRIGTAYFRDLIDRFGGAHFALASYNAGEHRIARWIAERPGIAQDEFIDDIPFPETQNYVKKVLGTAEDYRRLYGKAENRAPKAKSPTPTKKPAAKRPTTKRKP